ncbi:ferritin-like domain-containing protein [Paenibacillus piri]|uniref:Ferritin-like domain-containing protein n=1 Tax=Paenibacillus piri TaxID=2547395 RepID=A0A4R5KRX6_9BACL|nr:ferritin-like domain-containing protein [Paenibacillus piri]TDF97570.1 ferritin-like domain-containing protein [Paenibacillus piri]
MSLQPLSEQAGYPSVVKLPYRDVRKFLEQIAWCVDHTATLIRAYAQLVKLAPSEVEAEEVKTMMQQEKKQFTLLESLYRELMGGEPMARPEPHDFTTYEDGLKYAVSLERVAIRHYRDTYLLTPSMKVRDIFFYALSDGTEHIVGLLMLQLGKPHQTDI